jgi:hypothetical protein
MKRNLGNFDRIFRVLIAAVIAVLYITHIISGTLAIILLIIGAIFLITAFISVCPLYLLFGINTNRTKREQ